MVAKKFIQCELIFLMFKKLTVLNTLCLLFLFFSLALSASLAISPSKRYIQAGSFTLRLLNSSSNSQNFKFPYIYPTAGTPKLGFAVIDVLKYMFTNAIDLILSVDSIGQSSITVTLKSSSVSRISLLSIKYYVAQPEYGASPIFSSYSGLCKPNRNITITNPYIFKPQNLTNGVDMNGGVLTFYSFTGLNISSKSSTLDIRLQVAQESETNVSVTISAKNSTYVREAHFIWMSYNDFKANKPNYASFTQRKENASQFATQSSIIFDFNTVVGLTALTIAEGMLEFAALIPSNTTIKIANNFNYIESIFMVVQTYGCPFNYPYRINSTCYDICPQRTYPQTNTLTCGSCPFDCLTCSSPSVCLSCDTSDHRFLDPLTNRCLPLNGYYQTNTTFAGRCASPCANCQNSASNCTSCQNSYFLNSSTCQPCIRNCLSCTNSSSCSSCKSGYILNAATFSCEQPKMPDNPNQGNSTKPNQGTSGTNPTNLTSKNPANFGNNIKQSDCQTSNESNVLMIVLIVLAIIIILLVLVFRFVLPWAKKRPISCQHCKLNNGYIIRLPQFFMDDKCLRDHIKNQQEESHSASSPSTCQDRKCFQITRQMLKGIRLRQLCSCLRSGHQKEVSYEDVVQKKIVKFECHNCLQARGRTTGQPNNVNNEQNRVQIFSDQLEAPQSKHNLSYVRQLPTQQIKVVSKKTQQLNSQTLVYHEEAGEDAISD